MQLRVFIASLLKSFFLEGNCLSVNDGTRPNFNTFYTFLNIGHIKCQLSRSNIITLKLNIMKIKEKLILKVGRFFEKKKIVEEYGSKRA